MNLCEGEESVEDTNKFHEQAELMKSLNHDAII